MLPLLVTIGSREYYVLTHSSSKCLCLMESCRGSLYYSLHGNSFSESKLNQYLQQSFVEDLRRDGVDLSRISNIRILTKSQYDRFVKDTVPACNYSYFLMTPDEEDSDRVLCVFPDGSTKAVDVREQHGLRVCMHVDLSYAEELMGKPFDDRAPVIQAVIVDAEETSSEHCSVAEIRVVEPVDVAEDDRTNTAESIVPVVNASVTGAEEKQESAYPDAEIIVAAVSVEDDDIEPVTDSAEEGSKQTDVVNEELKSGEEPETEYEAEAASVIEVIQVVEIGNDEPEAAEEHPDGIYDANLFETVPESDICVAEVISVEIEDTEKPEETEKNERPASEDSEAKQQNEVEPDDEIYAEEQTMEEIPDEPAEPDKVEPVNDAVNYTIRIVATLNDEEQSICDRAIRINNMDYSGTCELVLAEGKEYTVFARESDNSNRYVPIETGVVNRDKTIQVPYYAVKVSFDSGIGYAVGGGVYLSGSTCSVSASLVTGHEFGNWILNSQKIESETYEFIVTQKTFIKACSTIAVQAQIRVDNEPYQGGEFLCSFININGTNYPIENGITNAKVATDVPVVVKVPDFAGDVADCIVYDDIPSADIFLPINYVTLTVRIDKGIRKIEGNGIYRTGSNVDIHIVPKEGYELHRFNKLYGNSMIIKDGNATVKLTQSTMYKATTREI